MALACAVLAAVSTAAAPLYADTPAAAKSAAKISFSHLPLPADQLPNPGELMKLEVSLVGTRDSDRNLRGYIVRDGQLTEFVLPEAKYDLRDRPMYSFEINAPLAELSYQFVLDNPDGTYAYSQRYLIRRRCWPQTDLAGTDLDPSLQDLDRLKELYGKSMLLERNNRAYDSALKILEQLQQEIDND